MAALKNPSFPNAVFMFNHVLGYIVRGTRVRIDSRHDTVGSGTVVAIRRWCNVPDTIVLQMDDGTVFSEIVNGLFPRDADRIPDMGVFGGEIEEILMAPIQKEVRMPKQWRDWLKEAGLKSTYSSILSRRYGDHYLKGHGRHWRIDCCGNLDMSETFDTFDRWANSCQLSLPMSATNKDEFRRLVRNMLSVPPHTDED